MLHDPETYPDPFKFDPERHITSPGKEAQRDPRNVCFGYGRRICPGMYLAEASLFACIATSLTVFNIEKVVVNGVPIVPVHESTSGIIRFAFIIVRLYEKTIYFHSPPSSPFSQLPKAVPMCYQTSLKSSSIYDCRITLNLYICLCSLIFKNFFFCGTPANLLVT